MQPMHICGYLSRSEKKILTKLERRSDNPSIFPDLLTPSDSNKLANKKTNAKAVS